MSTALFKLWAVEAEKEPSILSLAIEHSVPVFGHSHVKPAQAEAIQVALRGNDTLVTVPTGYGKSLVYQVLPMCARFLLENLGKPAPVEPVVLVVSPLIALMHDQASKLKGIPGITPLLLTDDSLQTRDSSGYTHILASPEALLDTCRGRRLLLSSTMQGLVAVVIDEAHCIVKWGMGTVFRRWYGQVCQIRSFIPAHTPVIALTATAATETCSIIQKSLNMNEVQVIALSPDRANVQYSVVKVSREYDIAFKWLVDDLLEKRQNMPRVVVFCRSITTCTHLYKFFLFTMKEKSYEPPTAKPDIQTHLFAMFHSRVDDNDKVKIMSSMKESDGICRVLFCTIPFGMGVDILNIRTVIHYGPSSDIDDYLQESGRAGRDGHPSNAILFAYPGCTIGYVSSSMKKYVVNEDKCRRLMLLKLFSGEHDLRQMNQHSCCDVCAKKCLCSRPCSYQQFPAHLLAEGTHTADEDLPVTPIRYPSKEQLQELEMKLCSLREEKLNVSIPLYVGEDIASGFPLYVIERILSYVQYISCVEELEEICLVWNFAPEIMDIISYVCD